MKRILTIVIVLIAVSLNAQFKRYFDADKKPLDKRIQKGPYVLECATKEELNMSGNSANIAWDGDTPRLKTTQELADDNRDEYKRRLAGAVINYLASKYNVVEMIGMLDLDKYGNNAQKTACKAVRDWISSVQRNDFATRLQAISNAGTMEGLNAVSMDFSNNDATMPAYTYIDILIME